MLRKSAGLFRQVETKMYLPKGHIFKNSFAGVSGLVLRSDPGLYKLVLACTTSNINSIKIIRVTCVYKHRRVVVN